MATLDVGSLMVFVCAPFLIGVSFGGVVRRRGWPYLVLFLAVPFVAVIGVCLLVYLLDMAWRMAEPQWRNDYPLYLQSLGAVAFLVLPLFLNGTLPALAGYLLAWIVPRKVVARQ